MAELINMESLTSESLHGLAEEHDVPWVDLLLIAANLEGARSSTNYPRVRTQLRPRGTGEDWQIILPSANPISAFVLDDAGLWLGSELVAEHRALENDDVVLAYIRAGGRSLTLNTHSRSACTGCLFCPNVIEDASDTTLDGVNDHAEVLAWVCADNEWEDLAGVEVITVCSGCFRSPDTAVKHLTDLRKAAANKGFHGRLHLLSSVVREKRHLEQLAQEAGPFHLTLTLECFTRRSFLLKESKASLTLDESCRILDQCQETGMLGDFTYIAGLDAFSEAVAGLRKLADYVNAFPRIQVYQAHNNYMQWVRHPEARQLIFFIRLRKAIETEYAKRGLAPRSWENYRSLWYSEFAGCPVEGPRI